MRLIRIIFLTLSLVLVLSAREQVNVNFSDLAIDDFIKLISKITNKNILINHKITGVVDFVSSTPIYDDELMDIMISVLESKGFTLIQNGSLYEVVRSTEAASNNVKVEAQDKKLRGSIMVTQAIEVKGENVDIIAAKIRYLISKTAKLMTMKESNTILITDYPKNIETIKKVIKNIDTKNESIVKIIYIKNAEIKKLQARVADISKSLFNDKVESQIVKIIVDDNINGIIVVGNKANVEKVEALVEKLDVESNISKSVEIFNLKNSDVKSVLASLNEIISKQTYTDPALKPNVSMSEEINAVIAVGEPAIIKGIKMIIDELDKEKYQVYVQARIIEINKKNSESLGVKWGFAGGDVSSSGLYAMSANFGDNTLTSVASKSVLDYLGGIGTGARSAFALGATIDFLETNGASKSISNPSILCVNNKESSIYVGKTISVQNASTVGTTGLPTQSFKREEVGLTLKIKPRVSSVDKVTLDVEAILESVTDDGTNNATGQPVTSKQEVKTQAILRHGESIIIGGLVKSYDSESKSKVPLLGDIPFVGDWLFSSTSKSKEEDNLVVILTPYVIEKSEKLSQLQKGLGELAKLQREYNDKVFKDIEERGNVETQKTNTSNNTETKKEEF
ncbi:type II secretion system secretin GspD [Candidatus Sulfurimonas baltica]|uniref:Type II secretion system secretin GspD n=1 Tax=Candidatus Sulfurimonas baltica TaxID=2740404 RepID=A0A7S7RNW0_9BACT|nr:type II secretion system secretin GspD [Candidatus Sulfurimonas baltica]QOY52845.1 type II secretion system secretin GspD [Candidatus Sulfurimonas baltica]